MRGLMIQSVALRFVRLLAALLCLAVLAGCGRGEGLVPVRGKVTFHGGGWPRPGYIDFAPLQAAGSAPLVPGVARFNTAGDFVVLCGPKEGLMPGEYRVAVRCWEREPTDFSEGKSLVPQRFANPVGSGLVLKVKPGSKAIEQNWDIPAN
jgi:hypothetical protein